MKKRRENTEGEEEGEGASPQSTLGLRTSRVDQGHPREYICERVEPNTQTSMSAVVSPETKRFLILRVWWTKSTYLLGSNPRSLILIWCFHSTDIS